MKSLMLSLVFAFSAFNGAWAANMPEKIEVMGQELDLKFQQGDLQKGFIAEYIPPKEELDNWTVLFAVRFTPTDDVDLQSVGQGVIANLAERKQGGDTIANGKMLSHLKNGQVGVDFLVSSLGTDEKEFFLEHNVFIFSKAPKGLVSYQLARRIYQNQAQASGVMENFITDIPKLTGPMVKALTAPPTKPPFNLN